MADNDFFNQPTEMNPQDQQPVEPQTVSLGEKEYTQEELSRLVGLGETAQELETKWNRKVDDLYPEFTRRSQALSELEKKNAELEAQIQASVAEKVAAGGPLSAEEEARIVREQAKKFGLADTETARQIVKEELEAVKNEQLANQLVAETEKFLEEQAKDGKPKSSVKDVISYMDENGVGNYQSAYKLMYEKEIDDWKMKQLTQNRPSGLYTQTQSTAGGKQPVERQVNSSNLADAINEVLARG